MREENLDFGFIQIHKNALEDICLAALSEIEGVSLVPNSFRYKLLEVVGKRRYEGIIITIDSNNQVNIELKISVRYGLNITHIAQHVQNAIREAVSKTADIDLRDININVQGMDRGGRS